MGCGCAASLRQERATRIDVALDQPHHLARLGLDLEKHTDAGRIVLRSKTSGSSSEPS
jgi:hypothetical protein